MADAEPNRVPPLPDSKTAIFLVQPSVLIERDVSQLPMAVLPCPFSVRTNYPHV